MNKSNIIDGKLTFFTTRDGLRTVGFLIGPENEDIVVFIHGMGGNFYKEGFLEGAKELIKNNISFFSFQTRGAEVIKDFRDFERNHHLLGTALENFEDCTKDIGGALDFLEEIGFKRFHLMGHSTGCQKILYYALTTKDPRVKSLIHISPAEDYEIWKNSLGEEFDELVSLAREMISRGESDKLIIPLYERHGELWSANRFLSFANRKNWEAKMFNYTSLEYFSKVQLPTMIVLGSEDEYLPQGAEWYAQKLRNAYRGRILQVEIMPGDHSLHGLEKDLFGRIVEFIGRV